MATEKEAKAILRGTARALLEFSATFVAPLYWPVQHPDGSVTARNGTAFFLQTKEALFGVTAAHVIEGPNSWREHCKAHGRTRLRLGGRAGQAVLFDWDARRVDINLEIDVATFTISPQEIARIGRTVYSGLQTQWPPAPPVDRQGVLYAGFPAVGTKILSHEAVEFGVVCGTGLVSAINERDVHTLIEREYLEPVFSKEIIPEDYVFGGISGAPLLQILLKENGLLLNDLSGVIVSGPNVSDDAQESIPGFELISARRVRFIRPDGSLDHSLWNSLKLLR
jgi:hypothetical protein